MCVVGHSYGGLDGAEIKVVDVCMRNKAQEVGRMSGDTGAIPEWEVIY